MKCLNLGWLVLLAASSGCLTTMPDNKGNVDLASVLKYEMKNRVPVTAEATTAENAHAQAQALAEELDRERNAEMLTPASTPPSVPAKR